MKDSILQFTGTVDIQAAADGAKNPKVSILAYSGGLMNVPGWGPVAVDLQGLDIAAQVAILSDHDASLRGIVGHGTASIMAGQLVVEGTLPQVTDAAKQIVELAKGGFAFQASVGVQSSKSEHVKAGSKTSINGKTITADAQGFTLIRTGTLKEISIVALGADSNTSVAIAAQSKGNQRMSESTIVTEPTAFDTIQAAWNGATFHDQTIRAEADEIRAKALAGQVSVADFRVELMAQQLRDSQLHAIRANRPQAPAIHGANGSTSGSSTAILEGALLAHLGHESLGVKTLGAQTMEQARGLHANSMMDIIKATFTAEGREVPQGRDSMIRAAFSTHTLTTLLTTTGNKLLLDAYNAFPSAARQIARKLSANDFKSHTGYRLTGDAKLEEVGNAGEIKHGTLGQAAYPYSVKTFARMFGLTRQDIINDDLGAFNEVPAMLGRGSAMAIEQAFWTLVLANTSSFFAGGNDNYISGGTSVLASEGLGDAVETMLKQTDSDGNPINVVPRFLVVPPELKKTSDELFRSTTVNTGGAATAERVPNASVFYGLYEPIVSPYISNTNYTGNSTTQWYLFGDPNDVAAFGIAYLNGVENPVIESQEADFNTLGMQFRGYIDFGVCQIDHRGGVKSAGA